MPFILDLKKFLSSFDVHQLRRDYEYFADVSLGSIPPSQIGKMFGQHDIETREKQIKTLSWLFKFFENDIKGVLPEGFTYSDEQEKADQIATRQLTAIRFLVGACIYLTENNKGVLCEILKRNLGLEHQLKEDTRTVHRENNSSQETGITIGGMDLDAEPQHPPRSDEKIGLQKTIDAETRAYCFDAIRTYCKENRIQQIPANPDFIERLQRYALIQLDNSLVKKFPCSQVSARSMAWMLEILGYSVGALGGEALSHTTTMQGVQLTATAIIGKLMLLGGSTSGGMFLAPVLAGKAVGATCGVSGASALGSGLWYVGFVAGAAVGLPLDLTYKMTHAVVANAAEYAFPSDNGMHPQIGISLIDGQWYFCGEKIEFSVKTDQELQEILEEAVELRQVEAKDPNHTATSKRVIEELQVVLQGLDIKTKSLNKTPEVPCEDVTESPTPV